jgi:hypothetical protein
MDVAIVYFGLTRSTKYVYPTHQKNVLDVLAAENKTYKIFMHTWTTEETGQRVWDKTIPVPIDYEEYQHLHPDVFQRDSQEEFLRSIDINDYFYQETWNEKGHCQEGEWLPDLVRNHLCALESMKRGWNLVKQDENTFRYVMFVRPDTYILDPFPWSYVSEDVMLVPNDNFHEGYNDRFALVPWQYAEQYGSRIDGLKQFRREQGRIVSKKYVKYVVDTNQIPIQFVPFRFDLVRPIISLAQRRFLDAKYDAAVVPTRP